jgi:hypothetical protein
MPRAAVRFTDDFTDDHPAVAIFAPFSRRRFEAPWEPFTRIWMEIFIVWNRCWLCVRYRNRTRNAPRDPDDGNAG